MGNALYANWDESQQALYATQVNSSKAFAVSIGTVFFRGDQRKLLYECILLLLGPLCTKKHG
jgi:hypothetical protein